VASQADSRTDLAHLTPRELQVLELISHGLTNGEVARRLDVTVHAVKFHLSSIYRKLGVTNRTEAAFAFFQDSSAPAAPAPLWPSAGRARPNHAPHRPPQQTSAISALDLPTDYPPGPRTGVDLAREATAFPQGLYARLQQVASSLGVHPASVLLAGFGTLLHRYTGQGDFIIGVAYRSEPAAGLPDVSRQLWLAFSSNECFADTVERVETRLAEDQADAADVVPQVLFSLVEGHTEPGAAPGWDPTGFDLALIVQVDAGEIGVAVEFDRGLFEVATIRRMLGHLVTLLEAGVADPECSIDKLPILTTQERHQLLVEWNATGLLNPSRRADELIAAQAAAIPAKVALESAGERLTYGELEARANQLARYLQSLGVGPDVLVGICTERSLEMVVGLLGIMKAGGAYVPIDPGFPAERQRFMLQDAEVRVLLTQEELLTGLPPHEAEVVCLDRDAERIAAASTNAPRCAATPDHLAYVIYTSGSTGRPKGVQIPHRALVNFLTSMGERPGMRAEDVLVAVTTLSFDIAGLELYLPLVSGARVVVAARETAANPRQLAELIERSAATVVQATPTTWRMLVDAGWAGQPGLKVLCGGEALPRMLAEQLLERDVELWNMYGPTESTIWSTVRPITTLDEPLTIGRPIANTTLYILDDRLQAVPVGIPGELHIGGQGLARGYLKRPELTSERFIAHPFDQTPGARLYKTGDLARYRSNGEVEFLGRLDHQVKVRGFRIELGEIETALARHPGVQAAVVTTREDSPGDVRLIGYVIPSGESISANELRHSLEETLPSYMVPSAIVTLDAFPLTPNGKIDRKALPAPVFERAPEDAYIAPRTPLEQRLTGIWEKVLGIHQIGVRDDFFDLGATSIVAAELFARVERELGSRLPLAPVFQAPTIEALAQLLEKGPGVERWTSLVPIQPKGPKPPIFCVHGGAGTILHLQPLSRRLGSDQPFYGLQARGLYGGASPLQTVEEMAVHYLAELRSVQPHGPYYLAGYCFGAIVAFDMAHRLLRDGEDVAVLVTFNGPSSTWIRKYGGIGGQPSRAAARALQPPRPLPRRVVGVLTNPTKIRGWVRYWAFLARTRLVEPPLARIRIALNRPLPERVRESYFLAIAAQAERQYEAEPYPGPLIVFYGDGVYDDPDLGWEGLAESVKTFAVPGTHAGNRDAMAEPYVGFISDHLQAILAAAQNGNAGPGLPLGAVQSKERAAAAVAEPE
jgi:amino acid adenylation domain-containing protein